MDADPPGGTGQRAEPPSTPRLLDSPTPRPAGVYLAYLRVRWHELDPLGHANNATYLNWLEQAAIDHAAAAGFGAERLRAEHGAAFVARRHELDYLRPALAGDWLRVATWGLALAGARAHRAYEVARLPPAEVAAGPPRDALVLPDAVPPTAGDLVLRARTEWAFVDVATGRPRRIPADLRAAFVLDG